jgi:hypothetical protein
VLVEQDGQARDRRLMIPSRRGGFPEVPELQLPPARVSAPSR